MNIDILMYLQLAIILLVSIGVHEYAHAWTSDKLGDPTPKMMGRLTPNPLAHIDPLGFLMIFVIQFGWGKPVQINPAYYRRPLRDELMVALAGPASNIILSCISAIIILTLSQTQLSLTSPGLIDFWMLFGIINCGMAVFNMLPLPPLDGWRLVKIMVPQLATKFQMLSYQYSWLTFILLFAFVRFVGPFVSIWSQLLYRYIHSFFFALFMLF